VTPLFWRANLRDLRKQPLSGTQAHAVDKHLAVSSDYVNREGNDTAGVIENIGSPAAMSDSVLRERAIR
jgi:hypothetical protein